MRLSGEKNPGWQRILRGESASKVDDGYNESRYSKQLEGWLRMSLQRSIEEIIKDLSKPIPARLLRIKTVGGQKIKFLPWHTAVKFLDLYAPGWSYEIRHLAGIGGKLVIVSRISIPCLEGVVYREATGQEDEDVDRYGDPSSNAESKSLRRAAAKFGLGLSLYDRSKQQAT
jgi:hypothetical protein